MKDWGERTLIATPVVPLVLFLHSEKTLAPDYFHGIAGRNPERFACPAISTRGFHAIHFFVLFAHAMYGPLRLGGLPGSGDLVEHVLSGGGWCRHGRVAGCVSFEALADLSCWVFESLDDGSSCQQELGGLERREGSSCLERTDRGKGAHLVLPVGPFCSPPIPTNAALVLQSQSIQSFLTILRDRIFLCPTWRIELLAAEICQWWNCSDFSVATLSRPIGYCCPSVCAVSQSLCGCGLVFAIVFGAFVK